VFRAIGIDKNQKPSYVWKVRRRHGWLEIPLYFTLLNTSRRKNSSLTDRPFITLSERSLKI
jgi:hypothetical protein